jgi:hypothetical protein
VRRRLLRAAAALAILAALLPLVLTGCSDGATAPRNTGTLGSDVTVGTATMPDGRPIVCATMHSDTGGMAITCDWDHTGLGAPR